MSIKQLLLLFLLSNYTLNLHSFTIMIDPSGDAKHTGRVIHDTFERGITLQCAEQLKKSICSQLPNVRVVFTRIPGETIQPLQNASFANRLQVDLYLSIYFYHEPDIPSHISIYHYLTNQTDHWHTFQPLSFYHVDQAHLINLKKTTDIGKICLEILKDTSINPVFKTRGLFGIPFKPLVGIKAPALAFEAGLQNIDSWKELINPLTHCIKKILS